MTSTLACYYPGEEPCFLAIEIKSNAFVDQLITAIHDALLKRDQVVQLNNLYLYKTNVQLEPYDDLPKRSRQWIHEQPDHARLEKRTRLSKVFADGVDDSAEILHIMVSDPIVVELAEVLDDPDAVYTRKVQKQRENRISGLSPSYSPSEIAGSSSCMTTFLGGPHPHAFINQVPVAMFSPPLAKLQQNLQSLENVPITLHDVTHATAFSMNSMTFYDDEKLRVAAVLKDIEYLVGEPGEWDKQITWAKNIKPDAIWWHGGFAAIVVEIKNCVGIGGDALLQATSDYATIVPCEELTAFRRKTNFPIILVSISGSRLEISSAVCIESVYRSDLYTLDISGGFQCAETILKVTQAFKALSICYSDLKTYYTGVTASMNNNLSSLYPTPTSASAATLPSLTYRRFINRTGQPTSTLPDMGGVNTIIYTASLHDPEGADREVVVKFTARYNKDAHELLAAAKFAPKLHFCGPIVGGLYMVVMDYVKGKSLWSLQHDKMAIPSIVLTQVKEAVSLLHDEGFVFGDLRDGNILYGQSSGMAEDRALLVDFDWAGKEGEGRYPTTLNMHNNWETSVHPNSLMQKAQDLYQVDRLEKLCA